MGYRHMFAQHLQVRVEAIKRCTRHASGARDFIGQRSEIDFGGADGGGGNPRVDEQRLDLFYGSAELRYAPGDRGRHALHVTELGHRAGLAAAKFGYVDRGLGQRLQRRGQAFSLQFSYNCFEAGCQI